MTKTLTFKFIKPMSEFANSQHAPVKYFQIERTVPSFPLEPDAAVALMKEVKAEARRAIGSCLYMGYDIR